MTRAAFRAARLYWRPQGAAMFAQLQRAALSIQLNIAEGFAVGDRGRFGYHLAVAYGSAVESGELLEIGIEEELLPREFGLDALSHCRRCERLLLGLLKRYRPLKGHRQPTTDNRPPTTANGLKLTVDAFQRG